MPKEKKYGDYKDLANLNIIKKLKIRLYFIALILSYISLSTIAYLQSNGTFPAIPFAKEVPFMALANTVLTIILISLLFEIYLKRETEKQLHNLLFSENVVFKFLKQETVDRLVEVGLQKTLANDEFGTDIFRLLQNSAVLPRHRKINLSYDATIQKIDSDNTYINETFFKISLVIQYEEKLTRPALRVVLTKDKSTYNALRSDNSIIWRWHQPLLPDWEGLDLEFLTMEEFFINDYEIEFKKNSTGDSTHYNIKIPRKFRNNLNVKIKYKLNLMTKRNGHFFCLNIDQPTKNAKWSFDYSKADISYASIIDAITSPELPEIAYYPENNAPHNAQRVSVEIKNGWIVPKSSVGLVWRLNSE